MILYAFAGAGALFLFLSVIPYLAWHFWLSICCPSQDLKRRYGAQWALVTGASSGIGKALACKCADQGLNVVLVARPDNLIETASKELPATYPEIEFRVISVDLSTKGYVEKVADAVKDITIQVCFLNAGYIQTGFFVKTSLEKNYANLECNVGHVVGLSHLLINQLQEAGKPGCFVFTSSAAAVMPAPFASLYNSTKAFLSAFGSSIAAEVATSGIDVMVFHPSPVASRFASSADHKIAILDFFNTFAVPPEELPDAMFAAVGRCIWRDFGLVAVCFRMLSKIMDYNLLGWITAATIHTTPDYKTHAAL
eukprot:jgi/Ulvmu1/4696/UM002_0427.1